MEIFEQLQAWQIERLGKITASEFWKIMVKGKAKDQYFGETANKYIKLKVAEILTCEPNNGGRANTSAMEWGNSNEYEANVRFQEFTGLEVEYFGVYNPKFFNYTNFSGGSPDGLTTDAVVEYKCPFNSAEHFEHFLFSDQDDCKSYKPEYYWQIMANMVFTGRSKGFLVSFDPRYAKQDHRIKIVNFTLSDEIKETIIERIGEAEKQMKLSIEMMDESVELMRSFLKTSTI